MVNFEPKQGDHEVHPNQGLVESLQTTQRPIILTVKPGATLEIPVSTRGG